MPATYRFVFNRCIFVEKNNKGRYFGLNNPLFDSSIFFFPWIRNDGNKGFVEWLIFRFGWYPIPSGKTEVNALRRKAWSKLHTH